MSWPEVRPATRRAGAHASARRWLPRGCADGGRPAALEEDRGSQSLELAMLLPLVLAVAAMLLGVGLLGVAVLHTQQVAAQVARHAAVAGDAEVLARADLVGVDVRISPPTGARRPGDLVAVRVDREVGLPWPPGVVLPLAAEAVALVEQVP